MGREEGEEERTAGVIAFDQQRKCRDINHVSECSSVTSDDLATRASDVAGRARMGVALTCRTRLGIMLSFRREQGLHWCAHPKCAHSPTPPKKQRFEDGQVKETLVLLESAK